MVAVLAGGDAKPVLMATVERGGRVLLVKAISPIAVPPGRSLELWALPDGKPPRSLGLVDAAGVVRIALPAPAVDAFQGVPALAISLEPSGGSTTGAPTGPVLYSGRIERI
jgi:anti-sigma-K factor RskA